VLKRFLYYASRIIFRFLPKGTPYNEIPNVIIIDILNYNLYPNEKKKKKFIGFLNSEKKKQIKEKSLRIQ